MASWFEDGPITELDDGHFRLELSVNERELLRQLVPEVVGAIEAHDDRSTYRLFPPGYTEDLNRQVEFDRLMRDDLQTSHIGALKVMEETADAESLDEEQLHAWTRALNQLRLVLGTRLEITEEEGYPDLDPEDPAAAAWELYRYLAYLQENAVEALSRRL